MKKKISILFICISLVFPKIVFGVSTSFAALNSTENGTIDSGGIDGKGHTNTETYDVSPHIHVIIKEALPLIHH